MSEFLGIKSLLGVYGYKFREVLPTLLAFNTEELLRHCRIIHKKSASFDAQAHIFGALFEPIDNDRALLARKGLLNELKKELLYFDKIYVCPEEYHSVLNRGVSELEEVYERGYFKFSESTAVFHCGPLAEATSNTNRLLMHYWPSLCRLKDNEEDFISTIEADREEVEALFFRLKKIGFKKALQEFSEFGQFCHDIQARRDALHLNMKYNLQVVPIISPVSSFDVNRFVSVAPRDLGVTIDSNSANNVAHIILNKLPLPADEVSISRVMDFKEEPETRRLFLGMKRWLRKALDSGTSFQNLNEEIEYLTLEYKHFMKLHDIKTTTGTLEALVVSTAETIENLAKLKISKVAKSFFAIHHKRVALAEAEMTAPGREVSYLIHANNQFG